MDAKHMGFSFCGVGTGMLGIDAYRYPVVERSLSRLPAGDASGGSDGTVAAGGFMDLGTNLPLAGIIRLNAGKTGKKEVGT